MCTSELPARAETKTIETIWPVAGNSYVLATLAQRRHKPSAGAK